MSPKYDHAAEAAARRKVLDQAVVVTRKAREGLEEAEAVLADVEARMGAGTVTDPQLTSARSCLDIARAKAIHADRAEASAHTRLLNEDDRLAWALVEPMKDVLPIEMPVWAQPYPPTTAPNSLPSCVVVQSGRAEGYGSGALHSHRWEKMGRPRIVTIYLFHEQGRLVLPTSDAIVKAAAAHDIDLGAGRPGHDPVVLRAKLIDGAAAALFSVAVLEAFADRPVITEISQNPRITLPITESLTPPGMFNSVQHARCLSTLTDQKVVDGVRSLVFDLEVTAVSAFTPEVTADKLKRLVLAQRGHARAHLGRIVDLQVTNVESADQWGNRATPGRPVTEPVGAFVGATMTVESLTS